MDRREAGYHSIRDMMIRLDEAASLPIPISESQDSPGGRNTAFFDAAKSFIRDEARANGGIHAREEAARIVQAAARLILESAGPLAESSEDFDAGALKEEFKKLIRHALSGSGETMESESGEWGSFWARSGGVYLRGKRITTKHEGILLTNDPESLRSTAKGAVMADALGEMRDEANSRRTDCPTGGKPGYLPPP